MEVPEITQKQMIQQILRRNEAAKSVRAQRWEPLWDEVMQFLWPQMGSMYAGAAFMPGEKRGQRCYDGTPESALDIMVAGLQGGTIPENYPWFSWTLTPRWLTKRHEVKLWLAQCRDIALEYLAASNYGMATNGTYRNLAAFGTGIKMRKKEEGTGRAFSFSTLRLTDCVIFENEHGLVDSAIWEFKTSARNAVKRWGENAPLGCRKNVENGNHDSEHSFVQAIFPREEYNAQKLDNKNMPFASWIINPGKIELVEESGFPRFPLSVPRWDKLDDSSFSAGAQLGGGVYGRGPGIKILQSMAMLNKQRKTNLVAGEKMADPPLDVPVDGYEREILRHPGAINRYDQSVGKGIRAQPLNDMREIPFTMEMLQDERGLIKSAFHVDVFLTFSMVQPGMTATEADLRNQEKLLISEPMITRQKVEHLEQDLDWVFHTLTEMGYFPPPPDAVVQAQQYLKQMGRKVDLTPVFEGPLFMALKKMLGGSSLQAVQTAAQLDQITGGKLGVTDNMNVDRSFRIWCEGNQVPPEALNDPEEVQNLRMARQKELQDMKREQQAAVMAKAAGQLGKVPTGDGDENLMSDMVKGVKGGANAS